MPVNYYYYYCCCCYHYYYYCLCCFYLAEDTVQFRVVWKKRNYEVTFPLDHKVAKLKEHIQQLTGVFHVAYGNDVCRYGNDICCYGNDLCCYGIDICCYGNERQNIQLSYHIFGFQTFDQFVNRSTGL